MKSEVLKRNVYQLFSDTYIGSKKLKNYFYFWIDDEDVDTFLYRKNIFFILAIGRSGTTFLSNLLNKNPDIHVVHEPLFLETNPYQKAYWNDMEAENYIQNFRKKEIYLRIIKKNVKSYGEVNSFLRRHAKSLKKSFQNAHFFHLIRDGRDVVRSMVSHGAMKKNAPDTKGIQPKKEDPFRKNWNKFSHFQKVCWYWQIENKYLRESIDNTIHFEKIISDYEYLNTILLNKINVDLSEETWVKYKNKRKNFTVKYNIPKWEKWNKKMKNEFKEICGEEMEKNGYKI